MIDNALKWPLMSGIPLSTWIAPSNKLIMLGDAAHAMVPYMSQGAAMAVEDGAAIGEVLNFIQSRDQLRLALEVFEQVRMKRSYQMQEASLLNGKLWHFADGLEQLRSGGLMVMTLSWRWRRHGMRRPKERTRSRRMDMAAPSSVSYTSMGRVCKV
jgi:2-polyprenyl-6-methoxyphenol hydroxylase-like FAD-dependent oxidoreductase